MGATKWSDADVSYWRARDVWRNASDLEDAALARWGRVDWAFRVQSEPILPDGTIVTEDIWNQARADVEAARLACADARRLMDAAYAVARGITPSNA